MIAAAGSFSAEPMIAALRSMALNENPAYDHELRSEGADLIHDCGWGAAYVQGGRLVRYRSTAPCFEDPALDSLSGVRSDLLILHARRTKRRSTIAEANTHPFLARFHDREWAFCHNGEVRDPSQLSHDDALTPGGTIDSELLFLHVVSRIDPDDTAGSLAAILGSVKDFTSLNCFLLTPRSLAAFARRDPKSPRPRYYTLWRGRAYGLDVVSSEIVEGLGVEWSAIADGQAIALRP
jgi:glutamine phosphoribosylpyrophosphate amidotransferase